MTTDETGTATQAAGYRFTRHHRPNQTWCPWSHVSVVAPEQRSRPGNRRCPDECPASDVEVNPYADDQRYDPTLPDPADDRPELVVVLVATDPAVIAAVEGTGADTTTFERPGQAAAADLLDAVDLILLDRAALTTAAAVGPLNVGADTVLVLVDEPTNDDWHLAEMAGVSHVLVLPAAAPWLRDRARPELAKERT